MISQKKRGKNKRSEIKYEKQPILDLVPKMKFVDRHRLNEDSHPADWVHAFIPEAPKKGDSRGCGITKWCQFTNMKADMDFAGNVDSGGLLYKFEPFTPREIEKHLSLFIIQGLNPSPQLKMKARYQYQEQVQGNDLVASSIGTNFERSNNSPPKAKHCVTSPGSNSAPAGCNTIALWNVAETKLRLRETSVEIAVA